MKETIVDKKCKYGKRTHYNIHLFEHSVRGHKLVGHAHSVRLHRVTQAIREVADVSCKE